MRPLVAHCRLGAAKLHGRAGALERAAVDLEEAAALFRELDMSYWLDRTESELRAQRGPDVIELSLREMQLLKLFHRRAGEVLDRATIFSACWGEDYLPNSRTLDQHISQLRKRIEHDTQSPQIIRTVHGVGYRYDP